VSDLRVDPERLNRDGQTGIFVRAEHGGQWGNHDIATLDRLSFFAFLRIRGGENPWAENTLAQMLGYEPQIDDLQAPRLSIGFSNHDDDTVGISTTYVGDVTLQHLGAAAVSMVRDIAASFAKAGNAEMCDRLDSTRRDLQEALALGDVSTADMI